MFKRRSSYCLWY